MLNRECYGMFFALLTKKTQIRRDRFTVVICVTFCLLVGCGKRQRSQKMPLMHLQVARVQVDTLAMKRTFISEILSDHTAVVQPRVSGFLVSSHYQNGMPVRKGQLLYTIDPSDYNTTLSAAYASLSSAQAKEVEARNNYNRAIPLARINAISQSQLDQYTADFEAAVAAVKSAEQTLESARLQVEYTKLYAPINGVIAESAASIGDYVGVNTKYDILTSITNIDSVCVYIPIPVREYLQIVGGKSSASYDKPKLLSNIKLYLADDELYPIPGVYSYTRQETGDLMGTLIVVVKFPNPSGLLKVGMFACVVTDIGGRHPYTLVPQVAVNQSQGINSVWVVRADSTLEYRTVELGQTYDTLWIINRGVEAQEMVLLSGLQKARQGEKIAPIIE